MAIQNRRGSYADFNGGSNLQDGEFGIVMSGDTNTTDGTGVYIAPVAGTVHRLLTDDDLSSLISSGTWTPTVSRAVVSSAVGAWRKVGDVFFLSCIITFDSTQTGTSSIYIDGSSLPADVSSASVHISGCGASPTRNFEASMQNNKNIWIAEAGVGRVSATDVAGLTIYFGLTVIPR